MRTLETLVRDARRNAALAWVAVVLLLVAAGWSLVGGDLLWGGFALTGALVAVAPALWTRDPERMLPAEILAVLTAVVVARVAGVAISFTGYSSTAALALVLAVEIDMFTDVELTGWFSVPFVVVTTAALAAVWGVLEFASDRFVGTRYLTDTADLMWDLVLASAVGVLAGLLLWGYVHRYHDVDHVPDRDRRAPPDRDPHSLADSRLRYPVRAMQATLALVVVGGLVTGRGGLVFNGGMGLVVALVPDVLRWRYGRPLSAALALWLTIAGFLHGVGALGFYGAFGWYDQMTHVVTASLVAGLGYATVEALDRYSPAVSFPTWFRVLCIVLFVLGFGVLWEVLEFTSGGLSTVIEGDALLAQYGLRDVVLDLVFDGLAGLAVALWATRYFEGVSTFLTRRLRAGD